MFAAAKNQMADFRYQFLWLILPIHFLIIFQRQGTMWLLGAVLIGLVVPFTFIAIMPTNHRLLEPGRDLASNETRALLEKWGKLHAVRSLLSLLASIVYVGLAVWA